MANRHANAKFKSRQHFFYGVSIVNLVDFEWFRQINISPNPLFQQIAKYYIRQYLFWYGSFEVSKLKFRRLYKILSAYEMRL